MASFLDVLKNKLKGPTKTSLTMGYSNAPQTPAAPKPLTSGYGYSNNSIAPSASITSSSIPASNQSATSPTVAKTTTPAKSSLPPSGQQFVQQLYDTTTGARTSYGASQGVPDMLGGKAVQPDAAPINPVESPKKADPQSTYLEYLQSKSYKNAQKEKDAALNRLGGIQKNNEIQSIRAREDYERELMTSGRHQSVNEQAASTGARRASAESAYGAIEENAAARSAQVAQETYKQYVDAGASLLDAEQAAEKARVDAERFDYSKTQDTFSNELATKKFEEDQRQYGLDYALKQKEFGLDQQKFNADQAATSTTSSAKQEEALGGVNIINTLLDNPSLDRLSGSIDKIVGGNFGKAATAKNQFNQLKGILSLENRGKLKGQGAVSDFEGKTLDRAASALGRNLSDVEFKKQLKQVKGTILTSHGLQAPVLLVDPRTGQSQVVQSDSAGIAQAINDGLLVEYQ